MFTIDNERNALLAPYLAQLFDQFGAAPTSPEADTASDLADIWETEIIRQVVESEEGDGWTQLVVEGTAWRMKFDDEAEQLENDRESLATKDVDALNAQLMTNAAIGMTLMKETQRVIDGMILSGHFDLAKRVSNFRNRMGQTLNQIEHCIGPSAYAAAELMSESMTVPKPDTKLVSSVIRESHPLGHGAKRGARWEARREAKQEETQQAKQEEKQEQKQEEKARKALPIERLPTITYDDEETRSHLPKMLMVLGVLVAIWGVFVLPKATSDGIPVLTMDQLPRNSAIVRIEARPPSLFLAVSDDEWWSMARAEREELMTEIGATASVAGYKGAQFFLHDGTTVGRWLESTGCWLAKPIKPGSKVRS
ncbi:MAG: hypothetical protein OEV00_02095 [Acidobacteriota bacterium]|nr:hypothetical protein [Acidobacteriota bacterium]MDH3784099.1 hypothetical protein [Acidobacteriota bacterium]